MKKSDLSRIAQRQPKLHAHDAERIVNAILNRIICALAQGQRVELRGFGAFAVRRRDARQARNPRTGDVLQIANKRAPVFKAGKEMRMRLNEPVANNTLRRAEKLALQEEVQP